MEAVAGAVRTAFVADDSQFSPTMRKMIRQTKETASAATDAGRKIAAAGHAGVQPWMASSAAIRLASGDITNNIRAAERFVATIPGLSKALQYAFPVVGAIALSAVFYKMIHEVKDFVDKVNKMPEAIRTGFQKLNLSAQDADDKLHLVNDRLRKQIALIEGTPVNNLAMELDQSRIAANALAKSLQLDVDTMDALLKRNNIGAIGSAITGKDATSAVGGMVKYYGTRVTNQGMQYELDAHDKSLTGNARKTKLDADMKAIRDSRIAELANLNKEIAMRTATTTQTVVTAGGITRDERLSYTQQHGNQTANLNVLRGAKLATEIALDSLDQTSQTPGLQARFDQDKVNKQRASRDSALSKRQAEQQRQFDESIARQRQQAARVYKTYSDDTATHKTSTLNLGQRLVYQNATKLAAAFSKLSASSDTLYKAQNVGHAESARSSATMSLTRARHAYMTGGLSASGLARTTMGIHETQYRNQMYGSGGLREQLASAKFEVPDNIAPGVAVKDMTPAQLANHTAIVKAEAKVQELQNQVDKLTNDHALQRYNDQAAIRSLTVAGGMNSGAEDFFRQYTPSNIASNITGSTLSSVNSSITSGITTGKFHGASMVRGLAGMVGNAGLGGLESKFLGPMFSKMGSKGNPVWVRSADGAVHSAVSGIGSIFGSSSKVPGLSSIGKIFGVGNKNSGPSGLNTIASSVKDLLSPNGSDPSTTGSSGGILSSIGSMIGKVAPMVLPFLAGGGELKSGMAAIVGENGPELFKPSNSGTVFPNHMLGAAMGGGGGTINVDARGAMDPAATAVAVSNAIHASAKATQKSTVRSQHEVKARTPHKA